MRRKIIPVILIMTAFMTACGSNAADTRNTQKNQVEQVLEQQTQTDQVDSTLGTLQDVTSNSISSIGNTAQEIPVLSADDMKNLSSASDVDIDLTTMSSDMVYASVFNITNNPDEYIGSTIRMNGQLVYSYSEETGLTYANVVIADAAACCAQGIEFQLGNEGEYSCPEDYPEEGIEVIVTGTLETYNEGEFTYLRAGNSEIAKIQS